MDFDKKEISSYIDDVPFAVGPKFCPPRDVTLPFAVSYKLPPELFAEKYDFTLEQKVVAFFKAKEEEAEKLKDQGAKITLHKLPVADGRPTNGQVIVSASLWPADSILQPKSKALSEIRPSSGSDIAKKINLSDFENDTSSPFDYMELQTLNDFEELNTVFQGLCKNQKESDPTKSSVDTKTVNASAEEMQSLGNVSKSISFPLPENFDLSSSIINSNSNGQFSSVASVSSTSKSFVKHGENYLSYSYPNVPGAFNERVATSSVSDRAKRYSLVSDDSISCDFPALSQVPQLSSCGSENLKLQGNSHAYVPVSSSAVLRGSKSISDLSNLLPNSEAVPKVERSHTPPAKAALKSHHDSTESQTFVKNYDFQKSLKHNVWSSNGLLTYTAIHPEKTLGLLDPYDELRESEKLIVDSITDMGFQRGQVSRAVKHLGTDEKKVVEHLCQIQALEESGYDRLEAEAALHLHDYNKHEAIQYLDLLNQFQDLGFEKDAIKKALVQNKNDRDKVIDALLS